MSEQNTLQRTLEIMALLSRNKGYSSSELSAHFEVHRRTIQRTIQTIADAGYIVECNSGLYKINRRETKRNCHFDISDLLHFSKEEAWMLHIAIERMPGKNYVKENLVKKLYSIYSSDTILKNLIRQEDSELVQIIVEAVQNKWQIGITGYDRISLNENQKFLIAEPIAFTSNFSRFWAYVPDLNENVLIRLSGLKGVEATYEPYKYAQYHKNGLVDIFRGYGYDKKPIGLLLNLRAHGFMCEEFPMARKQMNKADDFHYELKTEVCDYAPVARFCLGLPGDVKVLYPDELTEYINQVQRRSNKNFEN